MKEAIIINLDGYMTDVVLVDDAVTGVFPIHEPSEPNEKGEAPEPILTGYSVAIRPPEGLYKPRFDLDTETWSEGLTPEELDAIQNAPQVTTEQDAIGRQLVGRELEVLQLRAENEMLGNHLIDLDIRLLKGGF